MIVSQPRTIHQVVSLQAVDLLNHWDPESTVTQSKIAVGCPASTPGLPRSRPPGHDGAAPPRARWHPTAPGPRARTSPFGSAGTSHEPIKEAANPWNSPKPRRGGRTGLTICLSVILAQRLAWVDLLGWPSKTCLRQRGWNINLAGSLSESQNHYRHL